MSNLFWESSRSEPSAVRAVAAIVPAALLVFLISAALARPLGAKFARRLAYRSRAIPSAVSQVPSSNAAISGQIVDSQTGAAISGGEVIVALEQPDGTGTDVVFTQTKADDSGHFSFRALPPAAFDVVAVATNGSGVAYDATVVVGVPVGTNVGAIPVVAEDGDSNGPARIVGVVTATSGSAPSSIRATLAAIQTISLGSGFALPVEVAQTVTISGADTRPITIPSEEGTSADLLVRSRSDCPASASPSVNCGQYTIVVPGSNPSVAIYAAGKLSYAPPAAGPALYSVRANAFMPYGTGAGVCIPSFQTAATDETGQPLKAPPGGTITSRAIAFSGCW
jgi:hypothetical protein